MRSIALVTFLVLASPAFADEPKGDLARLQGSWTTKGGPNKDIPFTLTIKDSKVEVTATRPGGPEIKVKGEIKLDDKASPKTLDWVKFVRADGNDVPENHGIYKLEGDTWTVCTGGPGNERPAEFKAGEGTLPNLNVWARVKPDDKPIQGDLARFQGIWTTKAGENDEVTILMTIKAKAIVARWDLADGTKSEMNGELRLNEKASPKTIDFINMKRSDGKDARDNLGIYILDGDKFKLCVGGPGNARPAEFKASDDGPPTLLSFSRKPE